MFSAVTAILVVPSIAVPEEQNILINPAHPDATPIKADLEIKVLQPEHKKPEILIGISLGPIASSRTKTSWATRVVTLIYGRIGREEADWGGYEAKSFGGSRSL